MGKTEQILPLKAMTPARGSPPRPRGWARPRGVDREAVAFQPDALAIEERPFPRGARSTIYVVMLLVITAVVWASVSKIDRVVVARGKLITVDPLMVVQPLETGVVRAINVAVGDNVKTGDVLATLDPTFTESAESANRDRLSSMEVEAERLEAELDGRRFPPADAEQRLDQTYLKLQSEIFAHRRSEYQASLASSDADAARLEAALVTNQAAQGGLRERISILTEVEDMRKQLFDKSSGSRLTLLQSRLEKLALFDQLTERTNQEKELNQQLASARQQKERYINNWIREVGEKLSSVREQRATARQQLETAERRRTLVVLRAPADGVVLELAQRWIGSVAKEAEPLVTLVPRDNRIESEVEVDAADIGRLRVGDPVRVKLDALPFQRHGTLSGTLRVISESSFQSEKGERADRTEGRSSFFRARVALDPPSLHDVPADFRLIPGMTTSAEVTVGKRTIISYLLDPIIRLFDEGLREP
jgi:hemolysin D